MEKPDFCFPLSLPPFSLSLFLLFVFLVIFVVNYLSSTAI